MTRAFYDGLAPYYHLIYGDWEASIERQAAALDAILRDYYCAGATTVIDVAAGIGTQALGLAKHGYRVVAADNSVNSVRRGRIESARRRLRVNWIAADMRALPFRSRAADLVLACDNALPHLLSEEAILGALREFVRCSAPGGGCVVTMRDYGEPPAPGTTEVHPYGARIVEGRPHQLKQRWAWGGPHYDLETLFEPNDQSTDPIVFRTRYLAIAVERVMQLMRDVGLQEVRRIDGQFFQPVLLGKRA